ncbi:MAG: hypothetical protein ACI9HK_004250 [Pirellulaceae bacterium]|jgi:hypothetical protein
MCIVAICGCGGSPTAPEVVGPATVEREKAACAFDVHWPPKDLTRSTTQATSPLLLGRLSISEVSGAEKNDVRISVALARPDSEADRLRWNDDLAFPEYSWMAKVRVRDLGGKWIWPNLPYLLRAHGTARIERYGGVDPTKGVDNDFAAVLIRPLDDKSVQPMVSAEWYGQQVIAAGETDRRSIVHVARSDDFVLHIPNKQTPVEAAIPKSFGVWLIYADIMDADMPRSWPRQGEYNGGILAYFEIHGSRHSNGDLEFAVEQLTPKSATGFDWEQWSTEPAPLIKNLRYGFD